MKSVLEMTEKELQEFRIDYGIRISDYPANHNRWHFLVSRMKVGGSIPVKTYKEMTLLKAALVRKKMGVTYRKGKDGTYRVWRLS